VEQGSFSVRLGAEPAEGDSPAGIAPGGVALLLSLVAVSAALKGYGLVGAHAVAPKIKPSRIEGRKKKLNTMRV